MKLRYNYRIHPTHDQQQTLARFFGCARVVYNDGLRMRNEAYERGEPFIADSQLQTLVTTAAKKTRRASVAEGSPLGALVQSLGDLPAAYRNFFSWHRGDRKGPKMNPPKPKKKIGRQSLRFTRNGFVLRESGRLFIAKLGDIAVRWSRPLPSEPSSVTTVKDATGRYFASFVVETEDKPLPRAGPGGTDTGIDLGLSSYAVLRGRKIASPKFFRRQEKKLRRAQRHVSRTQKGSNNRRKEDLNVKGMGTRRGRLGKSVHDQSLGVFARTLQAKCHRYGRGFVKVDRWFPSTQLCSTPGCGALCGPKGRDQLRIHQWVCGCRAVHDRDQNAESNLRAEGRRLLAAGPAER